MRMLNSVFAIAALMLVSSVASATVWHPTNEDTDFIQFGPIINTNGGDLVMFDESDFGGTALTIGDAGGEVRFSDNGDGTWDADLWYIGDVAPSDSILLSGGNSFVLGMTWDGGATYYAEANAVLVNAPDDYRIAFEGQDVTGAPVTGRTLAIDVAPVPVPAAVWLFGTGLLGLVGVARRRA
jgi:hypothetical protein